MILFAKLREMLPSSVYVISPYAITDAEIETLRARPGTAFLAIYPSKDILLKAIRDSLFCIKHRGFLLFFDYLPNTLCLRVHGVFWIRFSRVLAELRQILVSLFLCSSIEKIECLLLEPSKIGKALRLGLELIGFQKEGLIRKGFLSVAGEIVDGEVFGILREEVIDGSD